jgi:hypothetical protein
MQTKENSRQKQLKSEVEGAAMNARTVYRIEIREVRPGATEGDWIPATESPRLAPHYAGRADYFAERDQAEVVELVLQGQAGLRTRIAKVKLPANRSVWVDADPYLKSVEKFASDTAIHRLPEPAKKDAAAIAIPLLEKTLVDLKRIAGQA